MFSISRIKLGPSVLLSRPCISSFSVSVYLLRRNVVLVWKNDFDKSLRRVRPTERQEEQEELIFLLSGMGIRRVERTKSLDSSVII